MQIFGIHEDTEPPWLRIDLTSHATIPLDTRLPVPQEEHLWSVSPIGGVFIGRTQDTY